MEKLSDRSVNILLIGMGHQAKGTYITAFTSIKKKCNLNLLAVVDLKNNENAINMYMRNMGFSEYSCFVAAPEREMGEEFWISEKFKKELDEVVERLRINAVIVSTDPMCHFAYTEWALKKGLNVLIDKPLTLHPNSSIDPEQAKKIYRDAVYLTDLAKKTKDLQNGRQVAFMLLTQRRYHPAYIELKNKIKEVFENTGCPITLLSVLHNDGQWSLPSELIDDKYHGYSEGVGKLSHTGYHLIDIVTWLLKACVREDFEINTVRIQANVVRPSDLIQLLSSKYLSKFFGNEYSNAQTRTDDQLVEAAKKYGEVDAYLSYSFYHDDVPICTVNLNLLHSGLSQRTWAKITPGQINAKGRIKHELVHLYQGPFLGAELEKVRGKKDEYTNELPRMKVRYILNKKEAQNEYDYVRYYPQNGDELTEDRLACIEEFVSTVRGEGSSISSSVEDHLASIKLLAMSYEAIAQSYNGGNNYIIENIKLE